MNELINYQSMMWEWEYTEDGLCDYCRCKRTLRKTEVLSFPSTITVTLGL